MRTRRLLLGVIAAAFITGNASAATISADGNWTDWFGNPVVTPPDEWPDQPNGLPLQASVANAGGKVYVDDATSDANGPGVGGQPFDAEQFVYFAEAGNLYIGLITGFNPSGVAYNNNVSAVPNLFQAGDLFVDLDITDNLASPSYDFAVGLSRNTLANGSDVRTGKIYLPNSIGTGFVSGGTDTSDVAYSQHQGWVDPDASPYRARTTGAQPATVSPTTATVAYGQYGSHWFYEICISGLPASSTGIGLHWTMECGNDYIRTFDSSFSVPPQPPVVPVPAAAPMVMLGMAVVGLVRKFRGSKA